MTSRPWSTLLWATAATLPAIAAAQSAIVAEAPTPTIGKIYEFRQVDGWNQKELWTATQEVVQVTGEHIVVRAQQAGKDEINTFYFDRSFNPCRSLKGSDKVVCGGPYKFPIQIGNKHEYEIPWRNGEGTNKAKCEVTSKESIRITNSEYETLKIECTGFWTRLFGGSNSGKFTETTWYAPEIGRFVKIEFASQKSNGQPDQKLITELIRTR